MRSQHLLPTRNLGIAIFVNAGGDHAETASLAATKELLATLHEVPQVKREPAESRCLGCELERWREEYQS